MIRVCPFLRAVPPRRDRRHRRSRQTKIALTIVAILLALTGHARGATWTSVAILGDSISSGDGASAPHRTYAYRLAVRRRDQVIFNVSRGFWAVAGNRGIVDPADAGAAAQLWTNVVVVALGTNDWGSDVPIDTFTAAYQNLLDVVTYFGARVYCLTPLWRANETFPNAVGATLADYRRAITNVCSPVGVVLDGAAAVPQDPSYFADGLHPNDRGHRSLALFLAGKVQ